MCLLLCINTLIFFKRHLPLHSHKPFFSSFFSHHFLSHKQHKHHFSHLIPLFFSVLEMKRSLSSPRRTLIIFFFLLFFFSLGNCRLHSQTKPSSPSSRNTQNNQHHLLYCDSFSKRNTHSLCINLQRIHQRLHKQVSPSHDYGIDPRFGAEKRRVPTGPNPLHN